jgi:hypothetical protein
MRAAFKLGQRFGQRPLRRRAAAAIEELPVSVVAARRMAIGIAII